MRRKWKKKVYYYIPKDLPVGRYECVLLIKDTGVKKLIVKLEEIK